ncbi:MAG: mechanosensitive ion channel protein MscS [SAR86 cluster bacterium]|uniref:Small-conductance mechanosensitive channel n=1 Tax=SAR86 cluster bacterium TaxID=2030880 RepID=A0A2A5AEY3_9GAMM|nr:MAG: mechanosensitive ion channel protein MscS [SAR86 cluster bacterium]
MGQEELEQVTELYNMIITYLVNYSFQIIGAVIIMVIGVFLGRRVSTMVLALCEKKELDITLSRFFASCARIAIIAAAVIVVLPKLGIQVTPFIAAMGALGLGAGLAMQGLLSNYGAGLSIIFTRPFVVGDTIRVQGVWGVVKEVHLAHTLLSNEDGEAIIIPNKHIVGEIIHNSQADTIMELSVGIAYQSDPAAAIEIIRTSLASIKGLSGSRPVQIGIDGFGDSSIDIAIRAWAQTEQFHEVRFQANLEIHKALKENGIAIPFPQREVRMLS